MDFGFSEDQELLRQSAKDFLAKECPMTLVRKIMDDESGHSPELWKKMAELGWQGLILPEEYGGAGLNFVDPSSAMRAASASAASRAARACSSASRIAAS